MRFNIFLTILLINLKLTSFADLYTKAIYGESDLEFTSSSRVGTIKKQALSVAMMIDNSILSQHIVDSLYRIDSTSLNESAPVCDDNPWKNNIAIGQCSSFLVSPNKVLTAGHCIKNTAEACSKKSFVFDLKDDFYTSTFGQFLSSNQIYNCKSVVKHKVDYDSGLDYALIELDRAVQDRDLIDSQRVEESLDLSELYMIGYPLGLGSMVSSFGHIREEYQSIYVTNLDSFVGNSGSPVFSGPDNKLIGLLSRGEKDFKWNSQDKCFELIKCSDSSCRGEDVVKLNAILDDLGI